MPPTSLCVLSSAPHPPLSCPPPLPGQGSPCCPLCLSMQQWPWGRSLTLQTANLVSQNVSGGEKNKHNPVSVSMAVTCDSRRHRIPVCSLLGLVPGPTSSPFCPLVLCTHSPSVPKCWALRSPRLQLLWKKLSFSSQALRPPGWPLCPPLFPPLPLANKWGCTFAEPLFGVSMVGGKGLATPNQESSTSVCQDHGQPECTEELLRARHVWAGPAPAGGFRAEPSWRCGFLLQGQPAPASSHCLGWWSRGGKLKARRCHHQGSRWDTGILEASHCHR